MTRCGNTLKRYQHVIPRLSGDAAAIPTPHLDRIGQALKANYFDRERRTEGGNPTLGLILCTDKNDAVVKYLLGPDQSKKIFTSRYKLHLPAEAELATELKREIRALS